MVFRGHEITTGTANKGDALITLEITKSDGVIRARLETAIQRFLSEKEY